MRDIRQDGQPQKHHKMVRWFSPPLLLIAGIRAIITTVIGSISDNREVQAALNPAGEAENFGMYDYADRADDDGFWFDYVADLGDGWDATFTVARALAQTQLESDEGSTKRGQILVMGGDQVYPDPSGNAYQERTIAPYREACQSVESFEADLFALPGNHDWYDGLHEFSDIFASGGRNYHRGREREFDCWKPSQTRSYFAIRLPGDWWICGVDVQLDGRLNATQLDYFQVIAEKFMKPGDRIILCADQPRWSVEREASDNLVLGIMSDLFDSAGAKISLVIAGDIHHYSHYEPEGEGPHLVTSGGGGAFLHPTHKLPKEAKLLRPGRPDAAYKLKQNSPSKFTSRRLSYRNLWFPFINWDFALFIGLLYTLLAWILDTRSMEGPSLPMAFHQMLLGNGTLWQVIERSGQMMLNSPEFSLLVAICGGALTALNVSSNITEKILLGVVHSLLQFACFVATYCLVVELIVYLSGSMGTNLFSIPLFLLMMIPFGGLAGGFIFGLFLFGSLNLLGLQWTNAFSALRIADHKSFVRLHINRDGKLKLYPYKIKKTGRNASPAEPISPPIHID